MKLCMDGLRLISVCILLHLHVYLNTTGKPCLENELLFHGDICPRRDLERLSDFLGMVSESKRLV